MSEELRESEYLVALMSDLDFKPSDRIGDLIEALRADEEDEGEV
jgi:hypothetical protein